jgi:hypothetical protein
MSGRSDNANTALAELRERGIEPTLTNESYLGIANAGFKKTTLIEAFALAQLACEYQPITVRGLMYRAQAAGLFLSTGVRHYRQTARIVLKLRRAGLLPYTWIVDSTRRRIKPSSWSGLRDFAEDAAFSYRKNLWSRQTNYIEFFCEKDAMAGIIEPVTGEFDVHLNVIRGHVSETFVWNIAEEWKKIEKPILVYYLGDHDPAGLEIEASLRSKLASFTQKQFAWERLAITVVDFADESLLGFPVKKSGSWREYLTQHGDRCVEVDALPPSDIRERIKRAVVSHIDTVEWEALQQTEKLERETWRELTASVAKTGNGCHDDFDVPF